MPDDSTLMLAYGALVVLGIIIVLVTIRLFILLFRKRRPATSGVSDERRLEAESAIEAVELMIAKKKSEGYDVSEAVEWLNDAKDLFSKNRFTSCLNSLEAAKVSLESLKPTKVKKVKKEIVSEPSEGSGKKEEKAEVKKEEKVKEEIKEEKKEEPREEEGRAEEQAVEEVEEVPMEVEEMAEEEMNEEELQRKREEVKKELESMEIPEEEMSTEALIKKKMPKDYLPAKFEINVSESKIREADKSGKNTEQAKKYLAEAKAHFEAGRYTEALGAAVRSKKALGVGEEDHIPPQEKEKQVSQPAEEQVIEVTVESGKGICLNCGNPLKPGDKFCRKCGAKVQVEIYCTKCGTKAEPDDVFCGACGNKLRK